MFLNVVKKEGSKSREECVGWNFNRTFQVFNSIRILCQILFTKQNLATKLKLSLTYKFTNLLMHTKLVNIGDIFQNLTEEMYLEDVYLLLRKVVTRRDRRGRTISACIAWVGSHPLHLSPRSEDLDLSCLSLQIVTVTLLRPI